MSSFGTSVVILLFVCYHSSSASVSTSLWGKKIDLSDQTCLWQLQGGVVPALEEVTVCTLLRLRSGTAWTAFVYKAPGQRDIELGLQGSLSHLSVWLFGQEQRLKADLRLHEWYSICLSWRSHEHRLRVIVNAASHAEVSTSSSQPKRLAPGGTLTLGASHYVDASGEVKVERRNHLLGEIGLFKVWASAWTAEELEQMNCVDGDVVSWDTQQWEYSCPPVTDSSLKCEWPFYKIRMQTLVYEPSRSGKCSTSVAVAKRWLKAILPKEIAVSHISVSPLSPACSAVNNSDVEPPQGSDATVQSTCDQCFHSEVYVEVLPAADVSAVQSKTVALLSSDYSFSHLLLTSDSDRIVTLPVASLPAATDLTASLDEMALSDVFFRVNVTVSVSGSPTNPQELIKTWAAQRLEANGTMVVVNFILKEKIGRKPSDAWMSNHQLEEYKCCFHVQEYNLNSVAETQAMITSALTSQYDDGSVLIQTTNLSVSHIEPQNCLEETLLTVYGEYIWSETFPQVTQEMVCRKPGFKRAYRLCKLHIENDTTSWAPPDMKHCKAVVSIPDLDNVTVTPENAAEVVDMIEEMVDEKLLLSEELSAADLGTVVDKLVDVVNVGVVKPPVGENVVAILSKILLSSTDVTTVAGTVLNLTEAMGNKMNFEEESVAITVPLLAMSMVNTNADKFTGLTFGVSVISADLAPQIFLNQSFVSEPLSDTDVTISLPSELDGYFAAGEGNKTRVQFHFYGSQKLFQDPLITNVTNINLMLNSYIVSASIHHSDVNNLREGVSVTFRHLTPKEETDTVRCVFWDFQQNNGQGGWNGEGCQTHSLSPSRTSCRCDHLTNFGVLLDVSREPISDADSQILTLLSLVGCGISSVFLGITLITYLGFEKVRRECPSKILINLSAALLGLSMMFLLNSWLSSFSDHGLCVATAAVLHYFLLASFTWMGLEAVHMYLALVRVFNSYFSFYMLKLCAVGWGIPLLIVCTVLAINKDAYGNSVTTAVTIGHSINKQFCWLQHDIFFYVTVVGFIALILLYNICVFILVLIQIRRMKVNGPSENSRVSLRDLRTVASLTVLLGLTWITGFFSLGPRRVILIYLFTICNSLQGFFVFVFHCWMNENVRTQWRVHLGCGRVRHDDYSDKSAAMTGGSSKKKSHVYSTSVEPDSTTVTKISGSSKGSAPTTRQDAAHTRHMEDRTESPMAVRVEKHSQSVILTYFHGDTNSMVDAHFSRALGTVSRDKGPAKMKKTRKSIKLEKSTHSQECAADAYPRPQLPPGGLLTLGPTDDAPDTWHPFADRAGESMGLSSIAYSLSPEGLSFSGQQYATSLLNLLHNEQADVGPALASSSKPELHHSWMVQPGLREPVDPAVVFKSGRLDKKDLYWY